MGIDDTTKRFGEDDCRPADRARRMTWRDLLFAHWPVPVGALRRHVPAPLEIEEFEGTAWLAVAPFAMTGMRIRGLPPLPGLSRTLELNVRTYVRAGAVSGVWFFSLEAASWPAVWGARAVYHLNYLHARMSLARDGGQIVYESRRNDRGAPSAEFQARYGPSGAQYLAEPGSLEYWLTERYWLFAADRRGRLYRAGIRHPQWLLQPPQAEFAVNTMAEPLGIDLGGPAPLLHYAGRQDVLVWLPRRVS